MVKIKDTQFCMENLKMKRKRTKHFCPSFGVHSCIFQSTAGDQYWGGAKISPSRPGRVKQGSD